MSLYKPKKKKKKPSLKDKPKAKPNRQFRERTPREKAMLQKRMEARKEKLRQESNLKLSRGEDLYMTKDYRDFPDRKELK
jgi:hypothetical protein